MMERIGEHLYSQVPADADLEHIAANLRILAVPIDPLILDPVNARKHPTVNLEAVQGSLAAYGQRKPIVVNIRSGAPIVIAGNATLESARALRWRYVAAVVVDEDAVSATGFALADNRTAELAEWDREQLAALLVGLEQEDVDLAAIGFDDDFVASVLQPESAPGSSDGAGDEGPPKDDPEQLALRWGTAPGQLWAIQSKTRPGERHLVLCGDCRRWEDVERLAAGRTVHVAVTSPPYAAQREYDPSSGFQPVPDDEYVDWFELVQANVSRILAPDGSWFVNIKEHAEGGQRVLYVKDLTLAHVRRWGWRFVDELCWKRAGVPGGWPNRFKNGWEPVFHFCRQAAIKFRPERVSHETEHAFDYSPENGKSVSGSGLLGKEHAAGFREGLARPSNVLEIGSGGAKVTGSHPAEYPVGLPEFFVLAYSDEGDTVYDPFTGSGTTLVAAERNGRLFLGTEISPKYLAVVLQRMADLGHTPQRVG